LPFAPCPLPNDLGLNSSPFEIFNQKIRSQNNLILNKLIRHLLSIVNNNCKPYSTCSLLPAYRTRKCGYSNGFQALFRAVKTSQEIGIFAVRVDAIDSKAKEFYLKRDKKKAANAFF
jgi:hypothetical protein